MKAEPEKKKSQKEFKKVFFKNNSTYLPVNMQQFEDLTNEILTAVNLVADPHFLDAEYLAQVLMSAIHAYKHETGIIKKSDLFESVINRISCHVTYHVVEEIQAKFKAKAQENGETLTTAPGNPESHEEAPVSP